MPDLHLTHTLTQTLKFSIMQLVTSLWRTTLVSTVTLLSVDVINARHKARGTAKEGRWGIVSSCLKPLAEKETERENVGVG